MSLLDAMNGTCEDTQLIIAGDGCGIQGDFFPGAWQWKTSDAILMKIFGLTNKSDKISTKNIFFSWMLFCSYFVYFWQHKKYEMYSNWTSKISFTCNAFVQK